jgi:predicted transcriptional regulator
MSQEKEDFIRSKIAVKVLQELANNEDGNYSTKISESLNKTQSSISRILSDLNNKGLIKKGKRTKAQYYEVNYEGTVEYWYRKLLQHLKESDMAFKQQVLEDFENQEDQIKRFSKNYFKTVLLNSEGEMNLYEFLFTTYSYSISNYRSTHAKEYFDEEGEFPEYIITIQIALTDYIDLENYSHIISILLKLPEESDLRKAIEDIEN